MSHPPRYSSLHPSEHTCPSAPNDSLRRRSWSCDRCSHDAPGRPEDQAHDAGCAPPPPPPSQNEDAPVPCLIPIPRWSEVPLHHHSAENDLASPSRSPRLQQGQEQSTLASSTAPPKSCGKRAPPLSSRHAPSPEALPIDCLLRLASPRRSPPPLPSRAFLPSHVFRLRSITHIPLC